MKKTIHSIHFPSMRNEIHVEYHETVRDIFTRHNPSTLGIGVLFKDYSMTLDEEVAILDIIRKSGYTTEIVEQDHQRDHIFRGFSDAVKSALNHFDPAVREAAQRVSMVIAHYGNIAVKAFDQETAAIDDLLRELQTGDYPPLIDTLRVRDWVIQLETDNQQFKALMTARYQESATRPATKMKSARSAVDTVFHTMINIIESLSILNGIALYEPFIRELNVVTERYKNILAQQAGARKAKKE